MTAHGLVIPLSLAIRLFLFKENIHHVKLTYSLEHVWISPTGNEPCTPYQFLTGLLGGAATLNWARIEKKFSGFKKNWLGARAQECQKQLGYYHTQTQRVHSWPDKPFGSMGVPSSSITSCKLWLFCPAGIFLEDPAPKTPTDYSYIGFAAPSKSKREFGQNIPAKVWI